MKEVILQNNFIGAWFLQDPSVCDDLINFYEENLKHSPTDEIRNFVTHNRLVDLGHKKCQEVFIKLQIPDGRIQNYSRQLQQVCEKYMEKYEYCRQGPTWTIKECLKIQKYQPGEGYYGYHFERDSIGDITYKRHLVFLTYLNDVTDAGETEFYYQNLKVRPQKGLTIIWPAEWTHTHRGVPSMTETKYIITGWYNYN